MKGREAGMFRILVADDDKNTRILLKAVLEGEGYTVLLAEDGAQALKALERGAYRPGGFGHHDAPYGRV